MYTNQVTVIYSTNSKADINNAWPALNSLKSIYLNNLAFPSKVDNP